MHKLYLDGRGVCMIDKKRNNRLYEEYKKKTYEELDKIEKQNDLTETEMIIIAVAKLEKELATGKVEGIPAAEVFEELLK